MSETQNNFLDNLTKLDMLTQYMHAEKRLILLDYDGTLVSFTSLPQDAVPNEELYELLNGLIADPANTIYIVSGRDSQTLEKWLGMLPLNLIAEHGAKIKEQGTGWRNTAPESNGWKQEIAPLLQSFVNRCPGSFIEPKDFSLAWHYRNAEPVVARALAIELMSAVQLLPVANMLQILDGNKVVEVRNAGINKGASIQSINEKISSDFILAIGDDTTDDDMFLQLKDTPYAYTIKVGSEPSFAKYNLHNPQMIRSLLQMLCGIKK